MVRANVAKDMLQVDSTAYVDPDAIFIGNVSVIQDVAVLHAHSEACIQVGSGTAVTLCQLCADR